MKHHHLLAGIAILGASALFADEPMEIIKPKAVKLGDTVALVAPASSASAEMVDNAEKVLTDMGFKVIRKSNVTQRTAYLAGDDDLRARTFMEAWLDPEVDAILPVTGGYGAMRILDQLDYEAIRANPKPMLGFSDITALHMAIGKKSGVVTYHGPNIIYLLRQDGTDRSWAQGVAEQMLFDQPAGKDGSEGYAYDWGTTSLTPRAISPGRGEGRLVGGNLSIIAALMGTPYEIETEGRILFLEDVNEAPYRVDRMLCTLELAGKLEKPAAVILGDFRDRESNSTEADAGSTYAAVFEHYFSNKSYPVIVDFPVGHITENAVMPVGILAEVDAAGPTVRLLEDPIIYTD